MSASPALAQRQSQLPAHAALIGAQVCFGLFPVFGRLAFVPGGLTPQGMGAWRLVVGAGMLAAIAAVTPGGLTVPARADLPRLTIAAWMGIALNQLLYLEGLSRSTPINASLMMCLIPVFTISIATIAGHERFSARRSAGVVVALAGTLLLLFDRGFRGFGPYAAGNLLMAGNSLLYSSYLIVVKPLLRRYAPMTLIAWAYLLSLPFAPFFGWHEPLAPEPGHALVWWSLVYAILFPTVLAYILNTYALARVAASTTAIYVYTQPLIGALSSWLVFRERPTLAMLVAAVALFAGVWLVSREAPR